MNVSATDNSRTLSALRLVLAGVALCAVGVLSLKSQGAATQGYVLTTNRAVTGIYGAHSTSPVGTQEMTVTNLNVAPAKENSNIVTKAFGGLFGGGKDSKYPIMADESIMAPKAHGTTATPVQEDLRWNVDRKVADNICSFNRHFAEYAGYWQTVAPFIEEALATEGEMTFYDSVSGKPLFIAPRGRTMEDFLQESKSHGWPSFRDEEVVWENMRCVKGGEAVSVDGTHLGHNLPDFSGNRYCINLVSVAGRPMDA